jgi:large subunit ribosomal protein L15
VSAAPKEKDGAKKAAARKPRAPKQAAEKSPAKKAPAKKAAAKKTAPAKAPAPKREPAVQKQEKAPAPKRAREKTARAETLKTIGVLELHSLRPPVGAVRDKRRLGLGHGSGRGKTAGRGHKGQKSRSGFSRTAGFEGGQMPLQRRLPKRGFTNIFRKEYNEVNVARLAALAGEKEITPELLLERKVIRRVKDGVKILGHGEINKPVVVRAHAFSASARSKIEAAGGKAEVIGK